MSTITFWNQGEVFNSDGTLTLQRAPDLSDLVYVNRVIPDAQTMREHGATKLTDAEYQAWVNLIVAAPDLLAALEKCERELSSMFDGMPPEHWLLPEVRAALAKARGGK